MAASLLSLVRRRSLSHIIYNHNHQRCQLWKNSSPSAPAKRSSDIRSVSHAVRFSSDSTQKSSLRKGQRVFLMGAGIFGVGIGGFFVVSSLDPSFSDRWHFNFLWSLPLRLARDAFTASVIALELSLTSILSGAFISYTNIVVDWSV
eukprot:TRINITY_DN1364_c0_g1_i6.p1 TRINITY_DN1364_c0_g1~~TRINITY_DN1364_c0_g1_i6.p1  ORF type:complete len:147 (+),score=12.10 TRINITY_DN1364_c0_g1_i6:160-600(+)